MDGFLFGAVVGGLAGGAAVWFTKDWILRMTKGSKKFVSDLEDQVRDLRQRFR